MIQPRTSNRDPTKAKPDLEKYLCGKIVFNRAGAYGVPFDLGHGPRETPWGDLGNASSTPLHMDALATRLQTKGENWTGLRWSTYSSIPNEQTSTSKHQENTQHPHLCPCLWTPTYAIHPPPGPGPRTTRDGTDLDGSIVPSLIFSALLHVVYIPSKSRISLIHCSL